jgi:hypothetical protein
VETVSDPVSFITAFPDRSPALVLRRRSRIRARCRKQQPFLARSRVALERYPFLLFVSRARVVLEKPQGPIPPRDSFDRLSLAAIMVKPLRLERV